MNIKKSKTRVGYTVELNFKVTQGSRDAELMIIVNEYLGCGNVTKKGTCVDFRVSKFADIVEKIIPLFKKFRIRGVKERDFED